MAAGVSSCRWAPADPAGPTRLTVVARGRTSPAAAGADLADLVRLLMAESFGNLLYSRLRLDAFALRVNGKCEPRSLGRVGGRNPCAAGKVAADCPDWPGMACSVCRWAAR